MAKRGMRIETVNEERNKENNYSREEKTIRSEKNQKHSVPDIA